jgi:uncharacterized protein (DUF1810 family)
MDDLNANMDPNEMDMLNRFLEAQEGTFSNAISELKAGRKRTHWMWFIFPQIDGLGFSETTRYYSIKSLTEARAYLGHPILGKRLLSCVNCTLELQGYTALKIFGSPDDLKFCSSLTLFEYVDYSTKLFSCALDKYFNGKRDAKTCQIIETLNNISQIKRI